MKRVDVTGQRFGRMIITAMVRQTGYAACMCICDCGKFKTIAWRSIKSGDSRSCGCIASERMSAMNRTHGETVDGPSPEWITWRSMHQRCTDPHHKSYHDYGARGIRICERWQSFAYFLADMGRRPSPAHSIDRQENEGNYEPGNCRWATPKEQARNRRPRRAA